MLFVYECPTFSPIPNPFLLIPFPPMSRRTMLAAALAAALTVAASARAGDRQPVETVAVPAAFDGVRFSCRIEPAAENEGFRVYRLSYPSPVHTALEQNNRIPAELYLPRGLRPGDPRRPAVICLHILDGNVELVELRLFGVGPPWHCGVVVSTCRITARGARPGGQRPWRPIRSCLPRPSRRRSRTSAAAFDVLASRPEIDPQRIGVMGISLGGILGRHGRRAGAADRPGRPDPGRRRPAAGGPPGARDAGAGGDDPRPADRAARADRAGDPRGRPAARCRSDCGPGPGPARC